MAAPNKSPETKSEAVTKDSEQPQTPSVADLHAAITEVAKSDPEDHGALPSIGRIVHYRTRTKTRPAIVIGSDDEAGSIDLNVFNSKGVAHVAGVFEGDATQAGTWFWPEIR